MRGVSLAGGAAVVAVVASLAANAATSADRWPGALDTIRQHPWYWVAGLAVAAVVTAGVMAWRQERPVGVADDPPPPPVQPVPEWVVGRSEGSRAITVVCRTGRERRAVAITTSLEGAGGFGKTTLAAVVASNQRVRRHFRGRVYTVTIGRDVRGRAAVAAKVAEVTRFITGDATAFDDPDLAGDHLGRLLDQRERTLLVLDDVWEDEQVKPFLRGGERCVRLVTTRVPAVLPPGAERVVVDEMTPAQARTVLTWELPRLPDELVEGLLRATGRWALLLRLTNRLIAGQVAAGADAAAAAGEALGRLVAYGPAAVDCATAALDLDDPARRARAVRATVEAATTLLAPGGARRLAELGVFVEDESIPVPLIARLWAVTGGMAEADARTLCGELDRLSLVSLSPDHGGRVTLHDVLRDYLRGELGEADLAALHGTLVEAMGDPWTSPDGYTLDHLVKHLLAAGRTAEAEWIACDIRWVEARLHQRGPLAAWADLHAIPTEAAAALADDLTRAAHLLTLTDPPALLTNVLHSRLGSLPHWQERITARQAAPAMRPLLRNHWPPPDLPDEGQIRTFLGHAGPVWSVAVSPDGASLTTIGPDGMARGLNPGKGGSLHVDVRGRGRFRALAAAPDGTWLATGGNGRRVHVWPVGRVTAARAVIGPVGNPVRGFTTAVQALAISPDGHRIAVATTEETIQAPDSNRLTPTAEGTVEVWDVRTERVVATTSDRQYRKVTRVAIAPDGTWLAVGGHDGVTLMSMDLRVKVETRGVSSGRPVTALAIAPNGSWVVSGEQDGTLQFWDEETLVAITRIAGHDGPVTAVAVAPDATWLASGGEDGTVRLWDLESEEPRARAVYVGHTGPVNSLTIAPDGGWLASAGVDGTVRIWKPGVPGQARDMSRSGWIDKVDVIAGGRWLVTVHRDGRVLLWNPETGRWIWVLRARPREEVGAVVVAQDGSWYATAHRPSRKVELWDRETGTRTARLDVTSDAMAIAPDGTWLAIADGNGAVQLWDRATGARTASLSGGNRRVTTVAIAPDGKWLAAVAHVGRAGERRDESTLKVFDVASGRCTQEIHCAQKLTGVAIAPDGRWLATSGADGVVSVWDPLTGELTASFTDPDGPVGSLAISPDGAWIATAGSMLRVWDRDAGRTVAAVRAETPLTSCAWMPDGRGLVAAGERGLHSYEFRP